MDNKFKKQLQETQDIEYLRAFCLEQLELNAKLHRRVQKNESNEEWLSMNNQELSRQYAMLEERYVAYKSQINATVSKRPLIIRIFIKKKFSFK